MAEMALYERNSPRLCLSLITSCLVEIERLVGPPLSLPAYGDLVIEQVL